MTEEKTTQTNDDNIHKKLISNDIECKNNKQNIRDIALDTINKTIDCSNIELETTQNNFNKESFCYKITVIKKNNGAKKVYFMKIYQNFATNPTQYLADLKKLKKQRINDYILLPLNKYPKEKMYKNKKYQIVNYNFINNINLLKIVLIASETKLRNGDSLIKVGTKKVKMSAVYNREVIKMSKRIIDILMKLKDFGFIDMDLSPDNFIIKVDKININKIINKKGKITCDPDTFLEICKFIDAGLIKIDHESMVKFQKLLKGINKPMKPEFVAPEVLNRNNEFDTEKALVYQLGCIFIFLWEGQVKATKNGKVLKETFGNQCQWKNIHDEYGWIPKYVKHEIFAKMIDSDPNKRPSLKAVKKHIYNLYQLFIIDADQLKKQPMNVKRNKAFSCMNSNPIQIRATYSDTNNNNNNNNNTKHKPKPPKRNVVISPENSIFTVPINLNDTNDDDNEQNFGIRLHKQKPKQQDSSNNNKSNGNSNGNGYNNYHRHKSNKYRKHRYRYNNNNNRNKFVTVIEGTKDDDSDDESNNNNNNNNFNNNGYHNNYHRNKRNKYRNSGYNRRYNNTPFGGNNEDNPFGN